MNEVLRLGLAWHARSAELEWRFKTAIAPTGTPLFAHLDNVAGGPELIRPNWKA